MKEFLLLLWGLYVLWPAPSIADQLGTSGLVVYDLASKLSGLPIHGLPEMHAVTHDVLIKTAGCRCPTIKALQKGDDVYLDESLDMKDVQNIAILLHELVHHLQYTNHGPAKDCKDWVDREVTAYQLQNQMLYRAGARLIQAPMFGECK